MSGKFKMVSGIVLVVTFSVFSLLILFALGDTLVKSGNKEGIGVIVFSFLFTLVLFYFPLQYGIKLWKSGVSDLLVIQKPPDRVITTSPVQITLRDYRLLMIKLTARTPAILYLFFLGLTFLGGALLMPGDKAFIGIVVGIVFISLPFLSILQAKKHYDTNKNLKETIEYEFSIDSVIVRGETFNSTLRWASLYKVTELDDWILLYTNKIVAITIPKHGFKSSDDLVVVRSFALNVPGIKKELMQSA
jgi:hypothetical protein